MTAGLKKDEFFDVWIICLVTILQERFARYGTKSNKQSAVQQQRGVTPDLAKSARSDTCL